MSDHDRTFVKKAAPLCAAIVVWLLVGVSRGEPPHVSYIFPAGGQRGTTVKFKVGGHYLHESCPFEMHGPGIEATERIKRCETVWFEGPFVPKPFSQQKEDYPKDYAGRVKIAADAPPGVRYWYTSTSQGVTPAMKFVVGELPELLEEEIDGDPMPASVTLPVTINGRIFPREDIDIWTFKAEAGEIITCEVCAARIGSPLDSRLEVRGPSGRHIAEDDDSLGRDSRLRFTVPRDGTYRVSVCDVNFGGLQHYVYRLTITDGPYLQSVFPLGGRRGSTTNLDVSGAYMPTEPVAARLPSDQGSHTLFHANVSQQKSNSYVLEMDDLPEYVEEEPLPAKSGNRKVALPAVLNGRISRPGDVDLWTFDVKEGQEYIFDLRAGRLGSPLDSVLTLLDSESNHLATADDIEKGQTDSKLLWQVPADGTYSVQVEDRLPSRGGDRFAYRLKVSPPETRPDFQLLLPASSLILERGRDVKLKVTAERHGGFHGPIELTFDGLPDHVVVTENMIPEGKNETEINLRAGDAAQIQAAFVKLNGKATIGEAEIVRRGIQKANLGEPDIDRIFLGIAMPTPFRFTAQFETNYAGRGSVHLREYTLERGGFEGPLEISMADRQVRHAQGIAGPKIVVPPGATRFIYPLSLSTFLEIGRTTRTNIMAVGVVEDADGSRHKVCYTTPEVIEQIVTLTEAGRLDVTAQRSSVRAEAGRIAPVTIDVSRAEGLDGPVRVGLKVPPHIRGVNADSTTLLPGETTVVLSVQFAATEHGPFNMPLTIRATMKDERGYPLVAETKLVVVAAE